MEPVSIIPALCSGICDSGSEAPPVTYLYRAGRKVPVWQKLPYPSVNPNNRLTWQRPHPITTPHGHQPAPALLAGCAASNGFLLGV
ncbi:MAG: hypothetical protein R3308_06435, partial [Thiohalobacterales bacterium]|nr:hypothetical protein [Thiohalobacterales bacterium]